MTLSRSISNSLRKISNRMHCCVGTPTVHVFICWKPIIFVTVLSLCENWHWVHLEHTTEWGSRIISFINVIHGKVCQTRHDSKLILIHDIKRQILWPISMVVSYTFLGYIMHIIYIYQMLFVEVIVNKFSEVIIFLKKWQLINSW